MEPFGLVNGQVLVLDGADSRGQGILVVDGRIARVGSDAEIAAAAPEGARAIDLRGRTVVPGLIDGHAHLDREGLKGKFPSLAGATSIGDIQEILRELVRQADPGEWIVTMPIGEPPAYRDVPNNLTERRWPTREDLDLVAPDNPVFIRPIWGYWRHEQPSVSVANTRALALAGIDRDTEPPSDAVEIVRDGSGDPTGVLIEWAYMPIVEHTMLSMIPRFTHEDRVAGILAGMRAYNQVGTTGVFEEHGASFELLRAYQDVARGPGLDVRARLMYSPPWSSLPPEDVPGLVSTWMAWLGHGGLGDDRLRVEGFFFHDGLDQNHLLRATTAPYTGWAGFHYDTGLDRATLKQVLIEAARNDIRPGALHLTALPIYEEVNEVVPIRGKRWLLGHLGVASEDEIARIKELGVVLTTHSNRHLRRQGTQHLERLGPEGENDILPLRRLVDAGVPVALATDNVPVTLFEPIWHTVARRERTEERILAPDQALTRIEALRAATAAGAYLTFEEDERGTLEEGKLADLAVLSADPLQVPEDDLPDIVSDLTMVGGRITWGEPDGPRPLLRP